jgi:hypothetical protein
MTNFFDAAIIGGGPAGAATAVCLATYGWRVLLNEQTTLEQDRIGETLPPEINPIMRRIGFWDAFLEQCPLPSSGLVSRWGSPQAVETDFVRNAFGNGWQVDRIRFDRMICRAAEARSVKVLLGRALRWSRSGNNWRADGFTSRFLVNAAGRNSVRVDSTCHRQDEDTLLAAVFRTTGAVHMDARTYIETAPAGGKVPSCQERTSLCSSPAPRCIAETIPHSPSSLYRLHSRFRGSATGALDSCESPARRLASRPSFVGPDGSPSATAHPATIRCPGAEFTKRCATPKLLRKRSMRGFEVRATRHIQRKTK